VVISFLLLINAKFVAPIEDPSAKEQFKATDYVTENYIFLCDTLHVPVIWHRTLNSPASWHDVFVNNDRSFPKYRKTVIPALRDAAFEG